MSNYWKQHVQCIELKIISILRILFYIDKFVYMIVNVLNYLQLYLFGNAYYHHFTVQCIHFTSYDVLYW